MVRGKKKLPIKTTMPYIKKGTIHESKKGQLQVKVPIRIVDIMNIQSGDMLKFTVTREKSIHKLKIELKRKRGKKASKTE